MRIDARVNDVYAGQQARLQIGGRAGASFSDAMNAAMANHSVKVDFTNMTRQELADWVNSQYFSEKISLDDVRDFTMMSVVNGTDVPEDARYNFAQLARGGIEWALSHKDETKLECLETCLQIMQKAMSGPE